MTATLFSLDIFVDILDVRYHGVLARRELVTLQLLLLLNRQLLQLGVDRSLLLLLLHGGVGRARTSTQRAEPHGSQRAVVIL